MPVRRLRRKRKNKKRSSTITTRDKKQSRHRVDRIDDGALSLKLSLNQSKQLPLKQKPSVVGALPSFIIHCKPKGTDSKSHDSWINTMSTLRAPSNKPYPRRSNSKKVRCVVPKIKGVVSVPNVDVVHLQQMVKNNTEVLGKFMWVDWKKQSFHHSFDQKTNMNINGFTEMDSGQKIHLIAYDNQSKKVCLFAKISREKVSRKLAGKKPMKRLRLFCSEMSRCMQNIPRGQQRGSQEDSGSCFIVGERANRAAPGIERSTVANPTVTKRNRIHFQFLLQIL